MLWRCTRFDFRDFQSFLSVAVIWCIETIDEIAIGSKFALERAKNGDYLNFKYV